MEPTPVGFSCVQGQGEEGMMGGGLVPVLGGGAMDEGQAQGPLPSSPQPLVPTPCEAPPKPLPV